MLGSLNICSIWGGEGEVGPYEPPIGAFKGDEFDRLPKEATMKLSMKVASTLAVLALGLVPATGVAAGPKYAPEHPDHPTTSPKGHAYGFYCKGKSKKHVKGEKGTAYSRCVKAVAQMQKDKEEEEDSTTQS
ncbi:MAG TPA: hypothetical protein VGK43_00445 [Solirubrobacterales bacterium]